MISAKTFVSVVLVSLPWFACGGGDDGVLTPETIRIDPATNNQVAPAGGMLPEPLGVEVLTSSGVAATRAVVTWSVVSGGGELTDTMSVVGGDGRAVMPFRVGVATGVSTILATLDANRNRSVQINARSVPLAVVSSVTPPNFSGGDTVMFTGSDLAGVDAVEFNGVRAPVFQAVETSLRVVAPVCLQPGAVTLTPVQSSVRSAPVQANYQASGGIANLAAGEYVSIGAAEVAGCASFPAAGPAGAEFLMVVQSVARLAGITASYRVRGDSTAPVTAIGTPRSNELPAAVRFHDSLRRMEQGFSSLPRPRRPASSAPAMAVGVGDKRKFRVCDKIGCSAADDFAQVEARAKFVGEHVILYQDNNAPSGGFTAADFDAFGQLVDQRLYRVASGSFGAESDVDQNGKVAILFTPVVNALTPASDCSSAIFTGFFFGIDIDPAFSTDVRSNKGEVFYALAADPAGSVRCAVSLDRLRQLVPVTLVHELQHMISYNQHVLLRNSPKEILWLDEALSHTSEELAAIDFGNSGDDDRFSQFATGNLSNLYLYLKSPTSFFVLSEEGTGTLEERGAGWWFLRWVRDHFGNGNTRALVETDRTGVENIEAYTGEPIERLLSEWALATWVSDLPLFDAPERLRVDSWSLRTIYQSFNRQAPGSFPDAFPIVPVEFSGGFVQITGAVRSGSGDYFKFVQAPSQAGFALALTNGTGGPAAPAAEIRLNVIRLR